MKKFLTALFSVIVCSLAVLCAACGDKKDNGKKPEKLKDGITLKLTENQNVSIDLSEYISIAGTKYAYTVKSDDTSVATVSLDGNTATVSAVAEGNTAVTASADTVSVSFTVTVSAQQQVTPDPAPADKTALVAELALEITEMGDYTEESYALYFAKLQAAKVVNEKADAAQDEVDDALNGLKSAREGLVLRVPEEIDGAKKTVNVISGRSREIDVSDYIDAKNLSSITYEVSCDNTLVNVGEPESGIFTVSAGETDEDVEVALTICVKYKGESKLTVTLTLVVKSEAQPTLKHPAVTDSVDIYSLDDKNALTVDFAQNVESNGVENLVYTVTSDNGAVTLDGNNRLTYNLDGTYSETETVVAFNVTVSYGEGKSIGYVYTLKICDTSAYRVVNGGFDSGLDGWTQSGEMGGISEESTFWEQKFPIFNEGKYFSGNGRESGKGTLTSSEFKVGGINKITFMLGAAGNKDCFITLEKTDGTVLAIWRNTKFADVGNWNAEEIGKTQFACNLVTYVADLAAYKGETLKIVLHDNAENGFGFFNFDELVTYYKSEADIPHTAVGAVNELADKTHLQELADGALTARGDYTDESYGAYAAKVAEAKVVLDKLSAMQTEVDAAASAIESAYAALEVRVPEEKEGANKNFNLLVNGSKELTVSEYVDGKDLSNLTYEAESADANITVGAVTNGKFTVTAGSGEVENATVSIVVKYNGKAVLTVTITVTVTSETAPLLKEAKVVRNIDLYSSVNKQDVTVDFADNVENLGGLELTYTVRLNGSAVTLDGTSYTYAFGNYTDTATEVMFEVTVSFSHNDENKEIRYNYTLNIKDTSANRLTNGGFDDGLDGWTLSNSDLGGVNADRTYWGENIPFNNDGNFFNAYYFNGEGKESATGALTSSPFVIGGSGWITYKLGGAKNADKVFLDIIEKDSGEILARYYNNAFSDDGASSEVRGCTLVAYKADLSAHTGKTVYIRISDNAVSDYGLFFADSFETYCAEAPENGFTVAEEVTERPRTIYDIYNGGFENNLSGWTMSGGEIGAVTSDKGYWNGGNPEDVTHEYGKEGDKLFSWWSWDGSANDGAGAEINREGNLGTLTSSMFVLKAGKYVAFKFGGGGNRNVFIELVNAESGSVMAVFRNDSIADGKLISYSYKADGLSTDALCYFRITDNANAAMGWGCFTADDFRVNLDSAPEGSAAAVNHKSEYYSVVNGSFETGNLDGWYMEGNLGAVTDTERAESWYQTNEETKDGNYLFTFHYNNGTEFVNVEGGTGIVRSGAFILEKNGIISFRFGAAHNRDVYINVYTTGGRLLATFRNHAYTQDTLMVQYYYQFNNTEEISCYFEVVDNATGDYGCIVMDDFRVNLGSVPENAVLGSDKTK